MSTEGPTLITVPERTELHCGDCKFFGAFHSSWCKHPKGRPDPTEKGRATISYEGDDRTPDWCPVKPQDMKGRTMARKGTAAQRMGARLTELATDDDRFNGSPQHDQAVLTRVLATVCRVVGEEIDAVRTDAGLPMDAEGLADEWHHEPKPKATDA